MGIPAAGPVGADHSIELRAGPIPWGFLLLARSAMIDLPTIEGTASSRLPWELLLLARLGDDHSIELQPGPIPWGLLLLDTMVAVTCGRLNGLGSL